MNAIVTGGTKGMGKAIALKLARAGYNLAVCSRLQSEIDDFCSELTGKYPINAVGLQTDCADKEQVQNFANFVQQHFVNVDVLVNNAGLYIPASILDESDDNLYQQLQVNLHSAYLLSKFFGKKMRELKSGYIFNICSVASIKPVVAAGSYSVTKAALLSLTKVLRQELMVHNVKVTAILPGSTLTDSWGETTIPSEQFVSVDDIADAVLMCLNSSRGANVEELVITPIGGQI